MAIVFAHEIHIFIPKYGQKNIFIPKSAYGGGGVHRLGNIPKNSFLLLPLSVSSPYYHQFHK